ncbi:unnamed protein product [Leptidea sinapis]|uniref:Uncharacterized protein n=1 Tax=Leptidea sinapis TaxID=189913 RepID=A0A5E4QTC2_9NEOP|nr:unnamed protein product [Leptidea sinapis]
MEGIQKIGLDINLPFIRVPLKNGLSETPFSHPQHFPKINVNLSSLMIAGVVKQWMSSKSCVSIKSAVNQFRDNINDETTYEC